MRYYLYSFGGCGTHFFRDVVFKNYELNLDRHRRSPLSFSFDSDIPEHKLALLEIASKSKPKGWLDKIIKKRKFILNSRLTPINVPSDARGVYLFGNPYNSIMSMFKRGQNDSDFIETICRMLCVECPEQLLNKKSNLDDFLDVGYDFLKLEEHFDNWFHNLPNNFIMVKYEGIAESSGIISQFLNIPVNTEKLTRRSSDYLKLNNSTQEKLRTILGSLNEKICNLPNIYK